MFYRTRKFPPFVDVFYNHTDSDSEFASLFNQISSIYGRMKPASSFRQMLKNKGYSEEAIEQLWKWYDYSEKKGVASY
jgi:hypothetical protein